MRPLCGLQQEGLGGATALRLCTLRRAAMAIIRRMRRLTSLAVSACLCLAACGGQSRSAAPAASVSRSQASGPTGTARRPALPAATRHPAPPPHPCPPRSAGALPQTGRIPAASTPCFHAVLRALWQGVRQDSMHHALYAFFPLQAYEQVKAIADPAGDYSDRLLADYRLDLHAAHELLVPHPEAARLIGAIVPPAYVHWVPPGACYNRIGYYEVPNSRVVYRTDGQVRSFGIASLISWRGVWYVVHLGAVTRSGSGGTVDDASDGAGTPAPSLTC